MKGKGFTHYIPYIIAVVLGLLFRCVLYAARGLSYTMDGHDLLNAVLLVLIVRCVYSIFDAAGEK